MKKESYRMFILVQVAMVILCEQISESAADMGSGFARLKHKRTQGMNPNLHRSYVNLYQQQQQQQQQEQQQQSSTTQSSPMWSLFVPPLPSPDEIECYVEVVRIRRQGGRCDRLGGNRTRPYICQSGVYFEFQDGCQPIVDARMEQEENPN